VSSEQNGPEIPRTSNPHVSDQARKGLRTIWEVVDFATSDPDDLPIEVGVYLEDRMTLSMVQEMLTDLANEGLRPVQHYLERYARYDDISEVEAAAQMIQTAIEN
jgi:hypothetical protein